MAIPSFLTTPISTEAELGLGPSTVFITYKQIGIDYIL